MKSIFAFFILTLCFNRTSLDAQPIFEHEWLGVIQTHDGDHACRLRTRDNTTIFTIYEHIANHWQVDQFNQVGEQIEFSCPNGSSDMSFVGQLNAEQDKISGQVNRRTLSYSFELNKRRALDPGNYKPILGSYRTKEGLVFYVRENQQTLHLHSPVSGEYVVLKSIGKNYFHTRTGEAYEFSKINNGLFQTLSWTNRYQNKLTANRFDPYEIEELVFYTRQDTIYGSLYLPKNNSIHPAVMLALGAGRFDRYAYVLEAELIASEGIASLIIDFPGTGKSSGNLHDITFEQKRDMTIDVFRQLQNHPKIDATRCGIRGGSQSGRIALMAAARIPDIAVVISVNVPLKSQLETQLFAINQFQRAQGIDEATNSEVGSLWNKYFNQIIARTIDTALIKDIAQYRATHEGAYLPNLPNTRLPRSPHPSDLLSNTTQILQDIDCPVLFQLAVLDERVPFTSTRNAISFAKENHDKLKFDVIEYPFANHNMMLPGYQITKNLFLDKIKWLKRQLLKN